MKGLVLLFLAIIFSSIGWRYCSKDSRKAAIKIARDNLFGFILATLAVAVAIILSVNTTLRFI